MIRMGSVIMRIFQSIHGSVLILFTVVFAWGTCVPGSTADTKSTGAAARQNSGMLSLIEMAPELYHTAKRYDRFYGDANTTHGHILETGYLFGNAGGARDYLVDHGVYVDFGVTQFAQRNVSGGDRKESRYPGSMDGWLWFDTGKAGLWPGGAAFLHGEGRWPSNLDSEVGTLLPVNFDNTMPDSDPQDSNWALSEWYLMQGLPWNFLALAGKVDMAAWADTNMFANRERSQFVYTGLINNPIAGVFFPYTALGGWLSWSPSKAHTLVAVWSLAEDSATENGFDNLTTKDNAYAFQYVFATEIAKRPGRYVFDAAYSTKEIQGFDFSARFRQGRSVNIDPLTDVVIRIPGLELNEENDNYAVIGNFSQYLWVEKDSAKTFNNRQETTGHAALTHHNNPPVGIGVFGRAGWAPNDRNAIDQFYSLGIGGNGMLIPGRDSDQWGIGWAGSHISSDLRDLPVGLDDWEHAYEVFYNFAVTPAVHLSLDAQYIDQADLSIDATTILSMRLQMDF